MVAALLTAAAGAVYSASAGRAPAEQAASTRPAGDSGPPAPAARISGGAAPRPVAPSGPTGSVTSVGSDAAPSGTGVLVGPTTNAATGPRTAVGTAAADRVGSPSEDQRRLAAPTGTAGVPVPMSEPATAALVRPGDRVDLLAVGREGVAAPVAENALVLDVADTGDPATGGLLLALRPAEARRMLGAAEDVRFTVTVRPVTARPDPLPPDPTRAPALRG